MNIYDEIAKHFEYVKQEPRFQKQRKIEADILAFGPDFQAALGVLLGTALGVLLQLGGYLLVRGARSEFGPVMFLLVPFVSGFAVAAVVRRPKRIAACCTTGGIITFSAMLFFGLEGIICCAMSSPLVAAGRAIGAFIGYRVRGRFIDNLPDPNKTTILLVLLCPLFIAAADRPERPFRAVQQHEVFTTETTVAASPERVWELVAEMHKLDGPRPFLLRAGLATPTRCELDRAGVGGRTNKDDLARSFIKRKLETQQASSCWRKK